MNRPITYVEERPGLSFAQRWNTYLSLALAAAVLALGVTMRDAALNATMTLEDLEAGIRAQVPQGWLLDRSGREYVFRAADPDALPFKTLLQVSIMPVGPDATPASVLHQIEIDRPLRFPAYRVISRRNVTLRDGSPAVRLTYAYVQSERNPALETLPIVVEGVDLVVLRGAQAVIVSYREERGSFENNLYRFENMLNTLEIF
ncbi:MAG: hypothetical protein IT325_05475 [Anaerolineae bacterium]|nr:hypothetical protein [Anaerolineae bacterium]